MARAQASNTGDAHAYGYANTGVHIGDVNVHTGVPVQTNYRKQVARIAPDSLVGRTGELDELAEFCLSTETAGAYRWWRAEAWSGKSALMSWFVLHPPPGVRIVSFFVTARWASQNNRFAFISNVLEQLLAILDRLPPATLSEYTEEAHLRQLLTDAAVACHERGERFVLLVDGLDEDRGVTTGPDAHSIAQLLPEDPPAGMRVIIAGRPNPPIPTDVPDNHPLRDPAIIRPLDPSPEAQTIRADMERELRTMLALPVAEQDVLGLLTAAGGGLTAADLTELTGWAPWQVDDHLHTVAGRSFTRRNSRYAQAELYVLGHEELQLRAQHMLGPNRLGTYRERLHDWADQYRTQNWPPNTPEYLLGGYYNLLVANNDLARMVTHATDPNRQDRLLDISGGDTIALTDLTTAQNVILEQPEPDLEALGRLVFHRDRLNTRNTNIPVVLPALWLSLGQPERARTLATSIPDQNGQSEALLPAMVAAITADDFPLAIELQASIPVAEQRRTAAAVVVDKAGTPAQIECVIDALANGDLSTVDEKRRDEVNIAIAVKAVAAGLDFAGTVAPLLDETESVVLFRLVVMWNLLYRTDFPPDLDQVRAALTEAVAETLATDGRVFGDSGPRVWQYTAMAMVAARIGDRTTCLDLFERARATIQDSPFDTEGQVDILVNTVVGVQPERPFPTRSVPTTPPLTLIAESGDVDLVRELVTGLVAAAGRIRETSQRDDTLAVIVTAALQAGQTELALDVVEHFNAPWRPANQLVLMVATVPSDVRPRVLDLLEAALGRFNRWDDRVEWMLRAVPEMAKAGASGRAVDLVHRAVAELHTRPDEKVLWAVTRAAVLLHRLRGTESADSVAGYLQSDLERARLQVILRLWSMWTAVNDGQFAQAVGYLDVAVEVARRLLKPLLLYPLDDIIDAIVGRRSDIQGGLTPAYLDAHPWASDGMLSLMVLGPAEVVQAVLRTLRKLVTERNEPRHLMALGTSILEDSSNLGSYTPLERDVAEAVELCRALRIAAGRSEPDTAARLFQEAIEVARGIDGADERDDALRAIVSAVADPEAAEDAARGITDVALRFEALRSAMSTAVTLGDVARAERLLDELTTAALALPDHADQQDALTSLVDTMGQHAGIAWVPQRDVATNEVVAWTSQQSEFVALAATAGADRVARLLAGCERAVLSVVDSARRGRALVRLGCATLEIGDAAWATRLVGQAEEIVRFAADPVARTRELTAAVRATGQSSALLALADASARDIIGFRDRSDALCDLARTAGDRAYAAAILDEVLAETTTLPDDQRDLALISVIIAAVGGGLIDHAETAALLVPDPERRAQVLAYVAAWAFDAGRTAQGARLTTRARNIVRTLTRRTPDTDVITGTARELVFAVDVLVKVGEPGRAAEQLAQLAALGRYATNSTVSDFVSGLVVEAATRMGDHDRAEVAALSMVGASQRNSALRLVAEAVAATGDMDRAEATALSIPDDHHRDRALRLVAVALARGGQVDRAESVARSVVLPNHRGWALLAVVEALPHDMDRARAVMKSAETAVSEIRSVPDQSAAFAAAAVVATNTLGDPELATRFLDHAVSDIGGQGARLLVVLRTVVTGLAPDVHPDWVKEVVTAMLPTLQWQDALGLLVENWPQVPWVADMVTDVPVPEIQSKLLIQLAAKSEPRRARRLMARAMTLVRWHESIDAFAGTYPEVVQAITDELIATAKR